MDAGTTEKTIKTFRIPEANVERLRADFAKLVKRAKRIKVAPPVLTLDELNPIIETHTKKVGGVTQKVVRRFIAATVTGETPKLPDGWVFAATLTRVEDGNIIASCAGEVPVKYRETPPVCDHCKLNRKRKETFLVVNPNGEWKQVGRDCIADFLGHTNPEALVAMAEMLSAALAAGTKGEEDTQWLGGSYVEHAFHLGEYVAFTAMLIRIEGWLGRKEAREAHGEKGRATADGVMDHMRPHGEYWLKHARTPEPCDEALAEAAIEWASELEVTNDFTHNLRLIARHGYVEYKHFGIAAYIAKGYEVARALAAQAAQEKLPGGSKHFGEVGKRALYTFTVAGTKTFPGDYGVRTLVTFRDSVGNVAKWFAAGEAPKGFAPGTAVTVKATVKAHGEYHGAKETTLTHVQAVTV